MKVIRASADLPVLDADAELVLEAEVQGQQPMDLRVLDKVSGFSLWGEIMWSSKQEINSNRIMAP